MRKIVSVRLDEELLAWADRYASQMSSPEKVITRTAVIEGGLRHLRDLARGGGPELGGAPRPASSVRLRGSR